MQAAGASSGAAVMMRRASGIGVVWALLWLALWTMVLSTIAFLDPDSIDRGEGPVTMLIIFGPMGLATGVLFGLLLGIRERGRSVAELSWVRVVAWGVLATAIVQLAYLGHGDAGLVANLKMALLFAVLGGVVSLAWGLLARFRARRSAVPHHVA